MESVRLKTLGVYEAKPGANIGSAILEIISQHRTSEVVLIFNEVKIRVYPNSCKEDLLEKYDLRGRFGVDPFNWE